jgi:peptide/nickel transport system ATP-binding protein
VTTTDEPATRLAARPQPVVQVDDLIVEFPHDTVGWAPVLRGVGFTLERRHILGVVGESGSGKSMLSLAMVGMVPAPGRVGGGSVAVCGQSVGDLSRRQLRRLRASTVGFVFQDPMASLNPVRTIGAQLVARIRRHRSDVSRREARDVAAAALEAASVPHPLARLRNYPHELSGGLRQRVLIAAATVNEPELLIADEPTTALDATIQAQVVELLRRGADERATVLVTHDLGLAAAICTDVIVMYNGRILEQGTAAAVLGAPRHPYTKALIEAVPRLAKNTRGMRPIPGQPPPFGSAWAGCPFQPRCPHAHAACATMPPLAGDHEHGGACWLT